MVKGKTNALAAAIPYIACVVLVVLCVLTIAALVEERSKDAIRLTVTREQVLPSVQGLQAICDCLVDIRPVGTEDYSKARLFVIEAKDIPPMR